MQSSHFACALMLHDRHLTVCEALIGHGATVNAEDDDKRTPLFYAVQQVLS